MGARVRYISYSLFTRRGAEPARWYDPFEWHGDRYWFNVPALVVANALFYPGAVMRVHVDPQTHDHALYPMLARLAERGLCQLVTFPHPYQRTEPSLWRMAPVFGDDDYDAVLCRDIDSLPTSREAQATLAFLYSDFLVQSLRTHPHHNGGLTRILAGLCAFRHGIKAHLFGTFDDYYGLAYDGWGTDQSALSQYFIDRQGPRFVKERFLDTCVHVFPGHMREHIAGHDAGKLPQDAYDGVDLAHVPAEARACLDALTTWPGQPVNALGEPTRLILDAPGDVARAVRDTVTGDAAARAFYQL